VQSIERIWTSFIGEEYMKRRKILLGYQLYIGSWKDWRKILVSSMLGEESKGRTMAFISKTSKYFCLLINFSYTYKYMQKYHMYINSCF
jgi:hypothetical protein